MFSKFMMQYMAVSVARAHMASLAEAGFEGLDFVIYSGGL